MIFFAWFSQNVDKVARLLLDNNAQCNVPDKDGNTPLHVAITKVFWACCFWFLSQLTRIQGHTGMVELLLNHPYVDCNTRNSAGHTALWLALGLPDQVQSAWLPLSLLSGRGVSFAYFVWI